MKEIINGKAWNVLDKGKQVENAAKIVREKRITTTKVLVREEPIQTASDKPMSTAKKVWIGVAITAAVIFLMSVLL
jgi:hypothetical protein